MTPKDKAKELYGKMLKAGDNFGDHVYGESARQSAIIAVDEITEYLEQLSIQESGTKLVDFGQGYWQEVKREIEKM